MKNIKYIFIIWICFSFLIGKSQVPKQKFAKENSHIDTNSNSRNQFYKITSRRPNGDTVIFWAPQPFESDSVKKNTTARIHSHDLGMTKEDSTRLSIQSGKEDIGYYLLLKYNKQYEYYYVDSLYNSGFRIDTNEFYKLHRERPIKRDIK